MIGAALTSALSAIAGTEAWPLRPAHVDPERRAHLLADGAEVVDVVTEHAALAAAFVDGVVGADELGVLLHEPREAVVLVDLLVGRQREDEIAGRAEALAPERRERDRACRNLVLHVEGAAAPDLAVDEVARPGIARPLLGIGAHRVGVGEERQRRAVAARQPGDEVEPVGGAADELAGNPALLEVVAQELRGDRLVARRVDGVEPEQLLEERRHLLAERHASAWDFAVSSFRTSHSSWYSTRWMRRPSTSTGVPCVPITCSPITRATTR